MGTRKTWEEKAKYGHLYSEPTMNEGVGKLRCPRCLTPIFDDHSKGDSWAVSPFLRNTLAIGGAAAAGTYSAYEGYKTVMPLVKKRLPGPAWLQVLVGIPPTMLWSFAWASFAGTSLPPFVQLSISSYYAAFASSTYAMSQLTRRIEAYSTNLNGNKNEHWEKGSNL